jgi:hypothetical protein
VDRIGLADTIEALRVELADAIARGTGAPVRFRLGTVSLDFHVGVTRDVEHKAAARFWVVELGGGATYTAESIQKVTVTLDPVGRDGTAIELSDDL